MEIKRGSKSSSRIFKYEVIESAAFSERKTMRFLRPLPVTMNSLRSKLT